jgi:hypothetical protein
MIYLQILFIAFFSACAGVTITKLTGIGDKIGFKPFNCFVCLSFWTAVGSFFATVELPVLSLFSYSIGCGFIACIIAYFLIDRIYR